VTEGNHTIFFEFGDNLIKFDSTLYNLLRVNSEKIADDVFRSHYSLDIIPAVTLEYINSRSIGNKKKLKV